MKLRELNIEKFRAIETTHLSFEDARGSVQPVTVLAGPNGCGKTSILFAVIQALRGLMRYRTDDVPEPTDLDVRRGDNGSFISLTPPEISVELKVEFEEEEKKAIQSVWTDTEPLRRVANADDAGVAAKLPPWSGHSVTVNWK